MSINLRIGNQVTFKVEGSIKVGDVAQRFDFELDAVRLPQSVLSDIFDPKSEDKIDATLVRVVRDWRGVYDGDQAVPYSEQALRGLLEDYPGLGMMAVIAYTEAAGAKGRRKN